VTAQTFALMLGLLAVVAIALAVTALVGRFAVAGLRPSANVALTAAFGVTAVAAAGSLGFSEIYGFVPCELCWFQRVFMYPLAVILGVAWWRGDVAIRRYAIPLAVIGAGISTYHVLVQRVPAFESGSCDPGAPCTAIWVEALGVLTIPTMALIGFVAAITLLATAAPDTASDKESR
jgi:disulfide bond formation protein DsbB